MTLDPDKRRAAASLFSRVFDLDGHDERPTSDRPLVRLCSLILLECIASRVSDLQLSLVENKGVATVQLQGSWKEMMNYPAPMHGAMVNRFKVMANLDLAKQPTQEGELRVRGHGREVRIRITVRKEPTGAEEALLHFPDDVTDR